MDHEGYEPTPKTRFRSVKSGRNHLFCTFIGFFWHNLQIFQSLKFLIPTLYINFVVDMNRIYKSKVAKWYIWFCVCMTIAFFGSIYMCYKSTWVLLIDIASMGICLFMLFDMLLHTDYTVNGEKLHIRCGFLFRMDIPISKLRILSYLYSNT